MSKAAWSNCRLGKAGSCLRPAAFLTDGCGFVMPAAGELSDIKPVGACRIERFEAADFMPTSRVTAIFDTRLRKPVSVKYRTSLGHAETEIRGFAGRVATRCGLQQDRVPVWRVSHIIRECAGTGRVQASPLESRRDGP